jgi:hypothetical protein
MVFFGAPSIIFRSQETICSCCRRILRNPINWIFVTTITFQPPPAGMVIGTTNQVTLNWHWNPEPDVNSYEVWRKYYRSRFDQQDWTLKSTQSSNSWTDSDFQLNSPGNTYTVYYKTRAKDNTNQFSSFSSETSTSAVMVFNKKGSIDQVILTVPESVFVTSRTIRIRLILQRRFLLPCLKPERRTLAVYDELGREVANLFDGYLSAGTFEAKFDAAKLIQRNVSL